MNKNSANYMFISLLVFLMTSMSSVFAAESQNKEHAKYIEESRKTAQEFIQTLGGTLKKQLELGGPESALGVCKQVAPALAAEYSKNGKVVKRVSLKARNAMQGTPDEWEKDMLESFDGNQQQGKPIGEMEVVQVTSGADGRWFRYMKAIPAQAMCMQCHGQPTDISAGVRSLLLMEYPQDKAIGYSIGQVRGAISIKHRLDDEVSVSQ